MNAPRGRFSYQARLEGRQEFPDNLKNLGFSPDVIFSTLRPFPGQALLASSSTRKSPKLRPGDRLCGEGFGIRTRAVPPGTLSGEGA